MKQETKELLEWIEKQINLAGTIVTDASQPYWQEDCKKALKFLNTLPEIENKLCFGGYIQDRNGIPCCHGDKVNFQYDEGFDNGTLTFNFTFKCFTIMNKNGVFFWINNTLNLKWFEKIEG